jgi:hypothetical protein
VAGKRPRRQGGGDGGAHSGASPRPPLRQQGSWQGAYRSRGAHCRRRLRACKQGRLATAMEGASELAARGCLRDRRRMLCGHAHNADEWGQLATPRGGACLQGPHCAGSGARRRAPSRAPWAARAGNGAAWRAARARAYAYCVEPGRRMGGVRGAGHRRKKRGECVCRGALRGPGVGRRYCGQQPGAHVNAQGAGWRGCAGMRGACGCGVSQEWCPATVLLMGSSERSKGEIH